MGFHFLVTNRLKGGSKYNGSFIPDADTETAMFYTDKGMGLGIWNDINARISERDDKSYATQVYAKATFGATRLQEEKIVTVDTLTTV